MALLLVPVAIAGVMLAMAWALVFMGNRALMQPFAEWLGEQLGGLLRPLVGAADSINGWITDRYDAAFNSAVTPLAHFVAAIPTHAVQLGDQMIATLRALFYALGLMGDAAVATAGGAANSLIEAALAPLWGMINFVNDVRIPNTEWFISAVQLELWNAVNSLTARLEMVEAWAGRSIDDALAGVLEAAQTAIDALRRDRVEPLETAVAGIRAALADAIPGIDGRIADAEAAAVAAAAAAQAAGTQAAAAAAQAAAAAAAAAAGAATTATQADVAAVAATAAAAAAAVATVTEWIRTCGEPLCTNFSDQIPHIHALNDLLTAGLVVAWVTAAITDPEGTARETDAKVAGPISEVMGFFGSLAGV